LNAQGWILRQRNNFHSQFEALESILGFFLTWALFIFFFIISSSHAVTKPRWLTQIAAADTGMKPTLQVPFQTIAKGSRSGVRETSQIVIRNQSEWQTLWKKHVSTDSNPAVLPAIPFDKEIVAAVFLGEKTTGGYDVEIVAAERTPGTFIISYREKRPPSGGIVIQALTQPFHIIRLARDDSLTTSFRRAP
jgi:PrcB C-terminal